MKKLLIVFSLILSATTQQDVEKTVATFNGFDDGPFFFIGRDSYNLEFEKLTKRS